MIGIIRLKFENFEFIRTAILHTLSALIFAVFDLSTCGLLINRRTCINFHFSYITELIIPPFYEFLKTEAGKEVFSKARLSLLFYLTVISFIQ